MDGSLSRFEAAGIEKIDGKFANWGEERKGKIAETFERGFKKAERVWFGHQFCTG